MDVRPNVTPSTATTSRVEARKIFAVSPNAGLVALAPGIGGIVTSVLVAVGLPMVAARVQRDLQRPPPPPPHAPRPPPPPHPPLHALPPGRPPGFGPPHRAGSGA